MAGIKNTKKSHGNLHAPKIDANSKAMVSDISSLKINLQKQVPRSTVVSVTGVTGKVQKFPKVPPQTTKNIQAVRVSKLAKPGNVLMASINLGSTTGPHLQKQTAESVGSSGNPDELLTSFKSQFTHQTEVVKGSKDLRTRLVGIKAEHQTQQSMFEVPE